MKKSLRWSLLMGLQSSGTRPFIGLAFFISLALSSCASDPRIKTAQDFGSMSGKLRDNTNRLADDIYNSCIRRVQFYRMDTTALREVRDEAWQACDRLNKPAAARTKEANKIAIDYVEAIGRLATDEVVSFDGQLETVGASLKALSIPVNAGLPVSLPPAAVDTGVQIASFIANWAANRYRTGRLAEAITCTNEPFQAYSNSLDRALRDGYIEGILRQEINQAQLFFDDYTAIAKAEGGTWRDFSALSKESYNTVLPLIQRRNAALAYVSIIGKTAKAHAELSKTFLNSPEPRTPASPLCKAYFARSIPRASAQKPFENLAESKRISPDQLMRANRILVAYRNDVSPLIRRMNESLGSK
jgi:hypothetical protein